MGDARDARRQHAGRAGPVHPGATRRRCELRGAVLLHDAGVRSAVRHGAVRRLAGPLEPARDRDHPRRRHAFGLAPAAPSRAAASSPKRETNVSETRIRCFVDFDKDGKQISHLQLPYSSNISAYGWIGIPICVIRNGAGPTLYLGAGNHGDEYEGQIALSHLIRDLDPAKINGRLIVMPATNLPAAMAGARCSPLDGGNLNRSFPGDPDGTPTQQIAHFVENVLMPMCDGLVDMHSGGKTLDYLPSALARRPPGEDPLASAKRAALEAFRAPIAYIVSDAREDRTITAGADRAGVVALGTELGGAGTVTRTTLEAARRGVRNMLCHFGLM